MNSKRLVICEEEGYARALALYLTQRPELSLQVQVCSSVDKAKELDQGSGIDYLFLGQSCLQEEWEDLTARRIFLLMGEMTERIPEGVTALYKFQSGEKLLEEFLQSCAGEEAGNPLFCKTRKKHKIRIIGIFSPIHRIGKTTYALRLGEELAQSENVLYVNMEFYGGEGGHFTESGKTLEDVLYYARQEKSNLGLILTTMVGHRNYLDFIRPMPVSEDMKSVQAAEWIGLLEKIQEQSIYEVLILDLDEGIPGIYELLRSCSEIHLFTAKDDAAQAKLHQFEKELAMLGYEDVLEKIIRKEGTQ